jgi:hypothetical protein
MIMKTIVSALLALSVLAFAAAPSRAAQFNYGDEPFDARAFFEHLANTSG